MKRFIGVLLWYVPAFCPGTSVDGPTLHHQIKEEFLVWIGHALPVHDARPTNNRPTSNTAARLYGACSITPNRRLPGDPPNASRLDTLALIGAGGLPAAKSEGSAEG
jgi:hypothetical protein